MHYFPSKGSVVLMAFAAIIIQDTIAIPTETSATVTTTDSETTTTHTAGSVVLMALAAIIIQDTIAITTETSATVTTTDSETTTTHTAESSATNTDHSTETGSSTTGDCTCTTPSTGPCKCPTGITNPVDCSSASTGSCTCPANITNPGPKPDHLPDIVEPPLRDVCEAVYHGYCQHVSLECPGGVYYTPGCDDYPGYECCIPRDRKCRKKGGFCLNRKFYNCENGDWGNDKSCNGPKPRQCCVPNQ